MALLPALRMLCICLSLLVTGAVAGPKSADAPVTLDITSSQLLGRPIFGNTLGPYPAGLNLTLTCSTTDPLVFLSWWEGEKKLQAWPELSHEMASASLKLKTLSVSDSGRKLSCRAAGTDVVKTVTLDITANLGILVNGKILRDADTTVTIPAGANMKLNCISQGQNAIGYTPSALTWFEGGTELKAQSQLSSYAASSVLALTNVCAEDSGRRFLCRSVGGAQDRVVQILVYGDDAVDDINDDDNSATTLRIILSVVCGIGMGLIILITAEIVRLVRVYKERSRANHLAKFRELFNNNTLLSSSKITKCGSQGSSSGYTLI